MSTFKKSLKPSLRSNYYHNRELASLFTNTPTRTRTSHLHPPPPPLLSYNSVPFLIYMYLYSFVRVIVGAVVVVLFYLKGLQSLL